MTYNQTYASVFIYVKWNLADIINKHILSLNKV